MASHVMTSDEVEDLKVRFGVRSSSGAPEQLVVDGFGTGLVSHSEAEWDQLTGEVLVFEVESLPEALPGTFDLSDNPEFPIVGNQASQGSCSAWAATYYSYGYLEAVDNGWTEASLGNTSQLLSPAWTYNMVNDGTDQGSWIDTNMLVIRDWGVTTMALMPYDDDDAIRWGSPEAFRDAPLHRVSEVGYLDYSPSTTVEAIKALIAAGTPVAFAMDANEYSSGFSDGNYIISSTEYSSTSLNHAQTLVGFDDTLTDDSDTGAFRVVNSWGSGWGDSGYYWLTYSALEELGDLELLYLNFAVDIPDYQPSLLGVWHFDASPSRASSITVGVGSVPTPENTKTPYYVGTFRNKEFFPSFMCLDMTEFAGTFWSEWEMRLVVGDARYDGVISSFRIEAYEPSYEPGVATQASGQSDDVPSDTPSAVSAYLDYYSPMSTVDAVESAVMDWSSTGQAEWVAVDHHSSGDGDSMQTGDVSDGASSRLELQVAGPADLSFDWSVSSQSGQDVLEFVVDEAIIESISGDSGWTTVTVRLDSGWHTLAWLYVKDGSLSALDDSGWIDAVEVVAYTTEPPVIALADSYLAEVGGSFTVEPAVLEYPVESTVTVWYDWGDDGPWSMATSEADYSASHVYAAAGTYILTAYAKDDSTNNVSDSASVRVLEPNTVPSVSSVTKSPVADIYLPGDSVTFELEVTDLEGGTLTVSSSYGDGSPGDMLSVDLVAPQAVVSFEFEHCYEEGSDSVFVATFTVTDGDEHVEPAWNEATMNVFVNSLPVAVVSVGIETADTGVAFEFDASGSSDAETGQADLQYRWDWTGDGVFDTGWSLSPVVSRSYDLPGVYDAFVEVMDGFGLVSSASVTVTVTGDAIPEFSLLIVPVSATMLAVFLARTLRRKKDA